LTILKPIVKLRETANQVSIKVVKDAFDEYHKKIRRDRNDQACLTNEFGLKYKLVLEADGKKRSAVGYNKEVQTFSCFSEK